MDALLVSVQPHAAASVHDPVRTHERRPSDRDAARRPDVQRRARAACRSRLRADPPDPSPCDRLTIPARLPVVVAHLASQDHTAGSPGRSLVPPALAARLHRQARRRPPRSSISTGGGSGRAGSGTVHRRIDEHPLTLLTVRSTASSALGGDALGSASCRCGWGGSAMRRSRTWRVDAAISRAHVRLRRMTKVPSNTDRYHLDRVSTQVASSTAPRPLRCAPGALMARRTLGLRPAMRRSSLARTSSSRTPLPLDDRIVPCRIVWVVDEPDAFGFGYGTLRGHPDEGEESFVVRGGPGGAGSRSLRSRDPAGLAAGWVHQSPGESSCGSRVSMSTGSPRRRRRR